jgi:hypothetical protein
LLISRQRNLTIELDVVGTATSVEYLDANFAFGQTGSVEPHNSQNPLQDLSTDHSWFRESTTQYQNITAEILRAESILDVADEVAIIVVSGLDITQQMLD